MLLFKWPIEIRVFTRIESLAMARALIRLHASEECQRTMSMLPTIPALAQVAMIRPLVTTGEKGTHQCRSGYGKALRTYILLMTEQPQHQPKLLGTRALAHVEEHCQGRRLPLPPVSRAPSSCKAIRAPAQLKLPASRGPGCSPSLMLL
jgi:hypothetical protein